MTCIVFAQTAQDPPCYNNRPAPAHYRTETGPDGQTIRVVGVWVDPAIDVGNFHTGTTQAMERWNGGNIPYRFERVSDRAQAGVSITSGTCTHGCACYSPATHTMRVEGTVRDNTADQIAGIITHELGHPLGLANSLDRTATPNVSVMQGYQGDCVAVTSSPRPNDVAQVNRHSTLRDTCTQSQGGTTNIEDEFEGACEDRDGDGWSTCDGDCDDYDPYNSCSQPTYTYSYCYSNYLVTDHYISWDGGQTWSYWYSDYEYIGYQCMLTQ
jgi:hypothetical protein